MSERKAFGGAWLRKFCCALAIPLMLLGGEAVAQPSTWAESRPPSELRPRAAPGRAAAPAAAAPQASNAPSQRPQARPQGSTSASLYGGQAATGSTPIGLYAPLRPAPRSEKAARAPVAVASAAPAPTTVLRRRTPDTHDYQTTGRDNPTPQPVAASRAPQGAGITNRRGEVCGVPGLVGESISPIGARVRGCGIANPVRITSVNGVRLSQAVTTDCETARALDTWIHRGLKPAFGATGGGIKEIQIAGSYVCRTRNHKAGARISEHGRGKAVDVSGIVLANGTRLSILRDWRGANGNALKAAHRAACGIFGTTLGPGSDGMHEDHLHFDTARHRNGAYCR